MSAAAEEEKVQNSQRKYSESSRVLLKHCTALFMKHVLPRLDNPTRPLPLFSGWRDWLRVATRDDDAVDDAAASSLAPYIGGLEKSGCGAFGTSSSFGLPFSTALPSELISTLQTSRPNGPSLPISTTIPSPEARPDSSISRLRALRLGGKVDPARLGSKVWDMTSESSAGSVADSEGGLVKSNCQYRASRRGLYAVMVSATISLAKLRKVDKGVLVGHVNLIGADDD